MKTIKDRYLKFKSKVSISNSLRIVPSEDVFSLVITFEYKDIKSCITELFHGMNLGFVPEE